MRIVGVTGAEIGGFQAGLQAAAMEFGREVHLLGRASAYKYGGRFTEPPENRLTRSLMRLGAAAAIRFGGLGKALSKPVLFLHSIAVAMLVSVRYRTLVLCGGSILTRHPRTEFLVYRTLRVRTIVHLHGSDARPWYLNGARILDPQADNRPSRVEARVRRQARGFKTADRWASDVVGYPGVAHFFTRPLIDRTVLGKIPSPALGTGGQPEPARWPEGLEPFRVLHAPTRPYAKGTAEVVRAVEALRVRGLPILLDLIEGASNSEVLDAIQRCHAVVDQLWADMPGSSLALESCHLGRPAIVGSWQASWLKDHYGNCVASPPVLVIEPDMLEETLREIIESRSKYEDVVNRVISWRSGPGSRKIVAQNWMQLLDGQIRQDWLFSPSSVTQLFFGFAPRDVIRDYVRDFVAEQGVGALGLEHRPDLQDLVVSFADL